MNLNDCNKGDIVWINPFQSGYYPVSVGEIVYDLNYMLPMKKTINISTGKTEIHCVTLHCLKDEPKEGTITWAEMVCGIDKNPEQEAAYQYIYEKSEDWMKDKPKGWKDVEEAFLAGQLYEQLHPSDKVIDRVIRQFLTWLDRDDLHGLALDEAVKFVKETLM